MFPDQADGANVVACVCRVVIGSLVFLGSRPVLWLSSTIGYREGGGGRAGDLEVTCRERAS